MKKKHIHIKEVLRLYNLGTPKKEIALKLGVTEKTIAKWINDSLKVKESLELRIKRLENEVKILKEIIDKK